MSNMMDVAGLGVGLNLTTVLASRTDGTGREIAHGLPPYGPTPVYDLADYPNAPNDWVRASDPQERTYFFAVPRERKGIWFDFQQFRQDAHDVAVRVSMQGIDALTGMRSDDTCLHWYKYNCPCHDVPFGNDRFCNQCGFVWPPVNFISTTGSRSDRAALWLDGFRATSGEVRQAIFVDDPSRGVAAQLIGENRSPAFAFVLYRSRQPKPRPEPVYRGAPVFPGSGSTRSLGPEVAAGALVTQRIGTDRNDPSYWQDEPAGIIRLYFAWADQVAEIFASHHARPAGGGGFLTGLRTGNGGGQTF